MIKKQLYRITGVNEAKQISKDYLKGFALDRGTDSKKNIPF